MNDELKKEALWNACKKWVEEAQPRCPESIYQMEMVQEKLYDLGEIVCEHVGYFEDDVDGDVK